MLKKLQKESKGFTIIEVMIVLAIAGLIILVVLLAVPALQRNGRNTAIRSDASQLLGYVSDFTSNNEGAMPTDASTVVAGTVTITGDTGTTSGTGKIQSGTEVTFVEAPTTIAAVTTEAGKITVMLKAKCGTSTNATHLPVASARSVAIMYAIENSGSVAARCTGS